MFQNKIRNKAGESRVREVRECNVLESLKKCYGINQSSTQFSLFLFTLCRLRLSK